MRAVHDTDHHGEKEQGGQAKFDGGLPLFGPPAFHGKLLRLTVCEPVMSPGMAGRATTLATVQFPARTGAAIGPG